jgi:hypothetical protein
MKKLDKNVRSCMRSFKDFCAKGGGVHMYQYQLEPANAILESVRLNRGLDFVVIMPRQAGKDEFLVHLKIYLMRLLCDKDRNIVEVNPTYKPQTIGAILRLENRMDANLLTLKRWKKRSDFYRMIGTCRTVFLSGDGQANVAGATANPLLVINEAQNILPAIYEKNFAPMAASRNATRVFCGTVWTSTTLLAQMTRACREAEQADGLQRVFLYTAEEVRKENKWYGDFVDGQVKRLGRNHPFVKTQFFCEEIDAQAGMFPPGRQALMCGSHSARTEPEPGKTYAFLIDVAGQDEATTSDEEMLQSPGRDSTALKIVEVDMSTVALMGKPAYLTVFRKEWTGERHVRVFGALRALAQTWKPMRIVIDATGVGEGLWSMLENAFGADVVLPVKFTSKIKSELGYGFIGMIDSGRYREHHPFPERLRIQLDKCRSEIVPGPAKLMRWGVPDGTRNEASGELVHDDDLMTGAMCSVLDRLEWRVSQHTLIVRGKDPLKEMDGRF